MNVKSVGTSGSLAWSWVISGRRAPSKARVSPAAADQRAGVDMRGILP
jgi:hypothetical protein